jgi:hypothetical protein
VVRVPGYRSRDLGSILSATRFSEKYFVWNGVHTASRTQLRSYLKKKVAAPVYKTEITAVEIRHSDHSTPIYPQKLALTSPTSCGRSVGIVRSRTQAMDFSVFFLFLESKRNDNISSVTMKPTEPLLSAWNAPNAGRFSLRMKLEAWISLSPLSYEAL